MVSHQFFYQLALLAIIWLSVSVRYVDRLADTNNRSQTRYLGVILAGAL